MFFRRLLAGSIGAVLTVSPLAAISPADVIGEWRGEGALALDNEPSQRFRCRVRFLEAPLERHVFSGRCATAQAAQSFAYLLHPLPQGRYRAENRAQQPHDLPEEMFGRRIGNGVLRFEAEGEALFELRLDGDVMRFRVESRRGAARGNGEVSLRRVGGG